MSVVIDHSVRTAFVSGAAGFVGSHVVRALVAQGVHVRALVRTCPIPAQSLLASLDVELVVGDLVDPASWRHSLHGCDTLIHLGAFFSPNQELARHMFAINAGGTQAILQAAAAAGVQRVVHTSTIGTIGRLPDGRPSDETVPFNLWRTGSGYVRSKWLGEAAALLWNRRGLPVVVVHPTSPVGAGDWKPTATGLRFVEYLSGQRPLYPPNGRNLCPVKDIAAGHLLAAQRGVPGRRYILGHAAGNLDERSFLKLLAQVTGLPRPRASARRAGRLPEALTADPTRAIQELGLPQSPLPVAFAEEVAYFRGRDFDDQRTGQSLAGTG